MNNESNKDILFVLAQRDLDAANTLKSHFRPQYEIVCFHCHQSAEKYLKGFIDLTGNSYPKIHDLSQLLNLCIAHKPQLDEIRDDCVKLTSLYTKARYENPFEFTEREMFQSYDHAIRIQSHVKERAKALGYTPPDAYKV